MGIFEEGKLNGFGRKIFENNDIYDGFFVKGVLEG
jgi:hypothetical protein